MSGPTTIRIPLGIEPVSPRNCALERNFVPSLRNPAFAFRLGPRWLTWVDAPCAATDRYLADHFCQHLPGEFWNLLIVRGLIPWPIACSPMAV